IALYIGGITAVLLELAEPRVRTGVWEHTTFRTDPIPRMERTGLAAMVTVYGARSEAEKMIAGITRMHAKVRGTTPEGRDYHALQPELMDWVQVTASYGFLNAYHHFVTPLTQAQRDSFYREALGAANLYGAPGAPRDEAGQRALFDQMFAELRDHSIVHEFLDIMRRTHALPLPLRPLEGMLLQAAVSLLPQDVRELLGLDAGYTLAGWQHSLIRRTGRLTDRMTVRAAPPAQACRRLDLPPGYLYRKRRGPD
ncbi:MAG: DUF2236 domain-containing protein, partial [Halioglobus sp.]|nr:DUF2236 domain-containing protein [Halioglobus sp.]